MENKDVLLQTTQNGNDEQLAITRPVDYIEQYRNSHKDLVMTGDDIKRNYTYDPATWTPSRPKESRGRAIAMGLTDVAVDVAKIPQEIGQWATGGVVGLKKTFFPNMDEKDFERTYRNVQQRMNMAAEARQEEIAQTGYPETYEWTNAIANLVGLYIPAGFAGASVGAAGAKTAAKMALGAKKGAEIAVGTLAGVQTTGQLSQEFAQKYAEDTGDVTLANYNPTKDTAISGVLGVISAFVNTKLDVARYAGKFGSKGLSRALQQGGRAAGEEFVEEATESITQDLGRLATGYDYDITLDSIAKNAITNGLMGAVLGGAAGTGLYMINKARLERWYVDKGLPEATAKKVADDLLTDGRSQILDQINTNYELAVKNGEAYNKVKDIYQKLYENIGAEKAPELADTYARMTSDWLTMHADQYGMATSLFIDANEAMDNMITLRQFTPEDVRTRISELKSELTHQKAIGEASNPQMVSDIKRKLRVLQKVDNINTAKENARIQEIDNKIANTEGLAKTIDLAWDNRAKKGSTAAQLAYLSNNKNSFKSTMVNAPAKVKNGLANIANIVDDDTRTTIGNALEKLERVNADNFIDTVSNSLSNTDTTLENMMLYHMIFEDQSTLSEFTTRYENKIQDSKLSTKDAIGQVLREIDELKQLSNPNYISKFGANGEMLDPNMLAAFISYQNQFSTLNQIEDSMPTYTGETININGVEKTVYNSNGERIAKSEWALRNFYNWFGNSKVVDEQGRPLVVYHGTDAKFDTFDMSKGRSTMDIQGAFFSPWKIDSKGYGLNVRAFYIKLEKPANEGVAYKELNKHKGQTGAGTMARESLVSMGYDGVNNSGEEYIVFKSENIKSVDNIGIFSRDNNNVYYQPMIYRVEDSRPEVDNWFAKQDKISNILTKHFGITKNIKEAGYILPNGKLLDFSGANYNGGTHYGQRLLDHRDLISAFENNPDFPDGVGMEDVVNAGLIRFQPESMGFIMAQKPTKQQIKAIENILSFNDEQLEPSSIKLELMSDANNWGNPDKTFSRIEYYMDIDQINRYVNSFYGLAGIMASESIVFEQGKAANGWYDPELATIALGRNFNELTLAHELAHHWLTQYFNLYRQYKDGTLKTSKEWVEDAEKLFSLIGIDPNQRSVTREQQEKWATMNEAYLTGFVPEELKNSISYKDFQQWIPEKYKSILQIGYLDKDNNVINPILSEADVEFFNKWYAHPDFSALHVQPEAQKWAEQAVSTKVMNDREKTIAQDWEEQESGIQTMDRVRNDNIPTDLKSSVDAAEVLQNANDSQEFPTLPAHKSFALFGAKNAQERMADIARNYVSKNPEHAKEIAMANPLFVENDTGVDREFLILAVIENENYKMGSPEYAQLMHNAARTRQIAGSTLGLHNTNSFKWYLDAITQIEETLENKVAMNYAGRKRNARSIYNADIERFVLNKVDSILATAKESKERDVALSAMFAEAKTKFSGNVSGTELTQLDLTGKKATRANKQAFIEWAKREIKRRAGVDITSEMQVELMKVSQEAQKAELELDNTDKAKAIAAAKTIREWQNKVNSYKKTSKGKVGRFFDSVFGEYAPRAMLFSPSTLLANVPGNVINGIMVSAVDKVYGKNSVSKEAIKSEIDRLKAISRATGMNFATMEKPTSPSILHGEKYKQTTGAIKAIDPFTYLSETDNLFRIPIFVDTLARIATRDATAQGISPTELFRQYCKINTVKGSVAQQARLEAIEIGNIAVFTQNGMLAKMATKIRDALNIVGTGTYGLGNLVSPFVKTPANIVEMGARAIAFPVTGWKTLLNWKSASEKAKFDFALDGTTLAVAALTTILMSALQDDKEWYKESYESGKYDPNKPYDSIRFGKMWIKLDQFGTLMLPMQVGAKLVKELQAGKAGSEVAESVSWQAFSELLRQTPVIDTFQENSMKWAATHPGQYALNYAYNQANKLVPSLAKQITRPVMREYGIILNPESKVGKRAVRNYGLDGQDNTINDWIGIIYGRLKVEQ